MRALLLAAVALVSVGFATWGCSSSDDGIKPEARKQLSDANSIAKRVDGDFDKLTADEKKQVLGMANGSEPQARQLLKLMAHPPNEAFLKGNRPGPK